MASMTLAAAVAAAVAPAALPPAAAAAPRCPGRGSAQGPLARAAGRAPRRPRSRAVCRGHGAASPWRRPRSGPLRWVLGRARAVEAYFGRYFVWVILAAASLAVTLIVHGLQDGTFLALRPRRRTFWGLLAGRPRSPIAWLGGSLVSGRAAFLVMALVLCAVASVHSGAGRQGSRRPSRRSARGRRAGPRRWAPAAEPAREARAATGLAPGEVAEAQGKRFFEEIRALARRGSEELLATIRFETWSEEAGRIGAVGAVPAPRPPTRSDLQLLLEDAARFGRQVALVRTLAGALRQQGIPLDWAAGHDCSGNFGRHALDAALEAAVGENQDGEDVALALLDLGLSDGTGSASQLNANPLLRQAAGQGMRRVIEKLVLECGADPSARDPRFGSTAFDRAAEAGHDSVAARLLELGADPAAGRGVDAALRRAGPRTRGALATRAAGPEGAAPRTRGAAPTFEAVRACVRRESEAAAMRALDACGPSGPAAPELAVLLEDAAKVGRRTRLLHRLCRALDGGALFGAAAAAPLRLATPGSADAAAGAAADAGASLTSAPAVAPSAAPTSAPAAGPSTAERLAGQRPLETAIRAAIDENPAGEAVALFLLSEGLSRRGDVPGRRLNANPLLRGAAERCMPQLLEPLVRDWGANVDAPDPRFGGTALDRALAVGCEAAARRLLSLGAAPSAGRGLAYKLERATSPEMAQRLRQAAA